MTTKPTVRQRNYYVAERAIIIIGVMSGTSLKDINTLLNKEQERMNVSGRELNETSYRMLQSKYKEYFLDVADFDEGEQETFESYVSFVFDKILQHIQHPITLGGLNESPTK